MSVFLFEFMIFLNLKERGEGGKEHKESALKSA